MCRESLAVRVGAAHHTVAYIPPQDCCPTWHGDCYHDDHPCDAGPCGAGGAFLIQSAFRYNGRPGDHCHHSVDNVDLVLLYLVRGLLIIILVLLHLG